MPRFPRPFLSQFYQDLGWILIWLSQLCLHFSSLSLSHSHFYLSSSSWCMYGVSFLNVKPHLKPQYHRFLKPRRANHQGNKMFQIRIKRGALMDWWWYGEDLWKNEPILSDLVPTQTWQPLAASLHPSCLKIDGRNGVEWLSIRVVSPRSLIHEFYLWFPVPDFRAETAERVRRIRLRRW